MKLAVLIRVYDRIEDLKYNLQIISDTWAENDYYIIVVSNGKRNGYEISPDSIALINKLVVLEDNAGHRKGNSQLLMEGMKYIPGDCDYTLILEADTWVYNDSIITKYARLLSENSHAVWASADWYDKYYALATDFAIIKTNYIKQNPGIFDFELFPECHIANFLQTTNAGFIWITENMPIHVPSYIRYGYPYVPNIKEGRFYVFPKSRMVTHHIEYLKGGMDQKKKYFNIIANSHYFGEVNSGYKSWDRFKMSFWIGLSKCFIKRSWYSKKTYKVIESL
ncbi:hypothetical protein JGH11_11450 [Dysgonomonas sp. Marseille-P4677]|uniref:glycosyltransferase family 2 protein n=1 Tax=Dysgonomonas sp. Marseille-P4677 TaxID=2364790 RepID=UPI0019117A14|nr:hypothetical protein [Dysgonomonas sp. Marseille-P4677]MBK5721487.1 hypothetical protein [Dysgonomonas sp. Marseille-P4677]